MKIVPVLFAEQFCFAGFHIVTRVALSIGVSKVVYPVYRNIIALLLLAPFAYFLEMKESQPLTFRLLVPITVNQVFYLLGLYYAYPTFASAVQNSVPAITFVMASALSELILQEEMDWTKVVGVIASVAGATIIALYKGPPLLHLTQQTRGDEDTFMEQDILSSKNIQNWRWGCIFLFGHCISWAGWMVLQPMQTLLVAFMATLILGDQLYSGGHAEIGLKGFRNLLFKNT
ncbi:hypothetical protein Patl1_19735 [Pistacia atlantica]|uniref:Uncharacterized protein n=1 Tax=Pistacia atlantica TaxID=434234 RepID=A0ACC1BZV7_9ROSI|nr:hypothetical protein Patl1_19735 [Pistacia atlantica]